MKGQEMKGQELHDRWNAAEAIATVEQIAKANKAVEEHMNEYGHSYAEMLTHIVEDEAKAKAQSFNEKE